MTVDDPDLTVLRRERPDPPERCPSCLKPIDPHNGECRCS